MRRIALTLAALALTGMAVAAGASRFIDHTRRSSARVDDLSLPGDDTPYLLRLKSPTGTDAEGEPKGDDARLHLLASRAWWGLSTPESRAQKLRTARAAPLPPLSGSPADWVNLGPTDARFQYNNGVYYTVDSGRLTGIALDPTNPAIVYVATAGGGVWKTFDFGSSSPSWFPITEGLGILAIGAMDLDPKAPQTLYLGLGDPYDQPGGLMVKSTDGGRTWSSAVALTGTPAGFSGPVSATNVRSVKVDPNNSQVIWAGTDVGLFVSRDGAQSFSLVDLPNPTTRVAESIWSVVASSGTLLVSGVQACDAAALPPQAGLGQPAGSGCRLGNVGAIWTSPDGTHWTAAPLPAQVGRITLGAGSTSVVYAQLGTVDESASDGAGYWRSTSSGASWMDATGTLANPTAADCTSVNVASGQAWYNQAIALDPLDDNHVVVGGMLCALRTKSGLSASPSWELVSHWLPVGGGAVTDAGTLPYAHADWHAVVIAPLDGGSRVFAGNDGALFTSDDVFSPGSPTDQTVTWTPQNRGVVSHLEYAVASGDPADGNPAVTFSGLQDNGTRFRETDPALPSTFNQVIGGDGIGAVSGTGTSGTQYWASSEYTKYYCPAGATACNDGGAWTQLNAGSCGPGDGEQFFERFSLTAEPSGTTVVSNTTYGVWRATGIAPTAWTNLACFATQQSVVRQLHASSTIDGLIGVALSGGVFAVTSGCTLGAATPCMFTISQPIAAGLSYASSVDFPPATPTGKTDGDIYVGASSGETLNDGGTVPASVGHLFLTADRGNTWTPLHGNGTSDLPNVPVNVVRYDPSDLTGNTLYVGTDLGVFRTIDGGATWARFGNGMPMTRVTDLFIAKAGNLLRASTYGRGTWEIYPAASAEHGANGDGDFDRNQQLDWFDVLAMAARLGTNPSTTAVPYYDWNLDMVGTVSGIDDADLSALMGKLGGTP